MAWYFNYDTGMHFESDKDYGELIKSGLNVALADQAHHGCTSAILNEIQKLQARMAVLETRATRGSGCHEGAETDYYPYQPPWCGLP